MRYRIRPTTYDPAIAFLSIPGLGISTYLTVTDVIGGVPACGISAGCESVTSSEFAELAGVPVSLIGMLFYSFMLVFALTLIFAQASDERWAGQARLLISGGALGFSAYLMAVAVLILESFCLYCTVSASLVTAIFLLSIVAWARPSAAPEFPDRTSSTPPGI